MLGLDAGLSYEDQESKTRAQPPSVYLAYCALARRVAAMDAALRSEPVINLRTSLILEEEIAAAMEVIQRYETTSLNL